MAKNKHKGQCQRLITNVITKHAHDLFITYGIFLDVHAKAVHGSVNGPFTMFHCVKSNRRIRFCNFDGARSVAYFQAYVNESVDYMHSGFEESRTFTSPMRPVIDTATLRCYSVPSSSRYPSNQLRMPARSSTVVKDCGGMEGKGLVLLLICGFYAILLFLVARVLNFAFSKVKSSVKSIFMRVDMTEVKLMPKEFTADDNNNAFLGKHRQPTRSTNHG